MGKMKRYITPYEDINGPDFQITPDQMAQITKPFKFPLRNLTTQRFEFQKRRSRRFGISNQRMPRVGNDLFPRARDF